MKVEIDHSRCLNTGVCLLVAPQIFKVSEAGKKSVPIASEIPRGMEMLCLDLALQCPTKAIRISEE